ncbi:polysaccharide deacetylase family protein [Asticcacaulis sp. 201]|uniref:polysaccharide deacetylase family protein n=1 Tax=Asticcacaulis sp. 201 TaxID=3028787 RepID=UPI002916CA07|nr:polysaccharide deacetylase family protein [Asticcacaulis sp. 201]MDV6330447.1 polysaccharide deacetylase family protein [Asticcacaulis sp. 201]
MKRILTGVAAVLALMAFGAKAEPFKVAITVDDLPAHGSPVPGHSREAVARDYLAALKAHKVPGVYGFINAVALEREPGTQAVLKLWRDAGYPLGNHGYTHMNINAGGLTAFEGDIEKNEPVLAELMAGQDWRVLRFPFLNAGTDRVLHKGIMEYLAAKGYRIADVTISFNDWAYTETYNRCLTKGDTATIEAMKAQYMQGVKASIARSTYGSQKLYGRQISHVLLIHEGAFTALMLPQVLSEFEAEGATFVSLDEAQTDPVYSAVSAHRGEGLLIERQAKEKGADIWAGAPADVDIANLDTLCR